METEEKKRKNRRRRRRRGACCGSCTDLLVNRGSSGAAQRPLSKESLFIFFIGFWGSDKDRLQREAAIGVRSPTILAKDLVPGPLASHGSSLLRSLHFSSSHS